jgi:DNA-binding GntR family transcriptional regulator
MSAVTSAVMSAVMCMQFRSDACQNGVMSRPAARVSGIERIELPEIRQAIPRLHAYLRACILDGRLPPGTKLSQVALAEQLGVSRTPLREVLRMLQEEGFVEFEPNQRMRVAGFDPAELDADYASRILLETLALSMTMQRLGGRERKQAARLLSAMRRAARSGDFAGWFSAHHDYHRIMTVGAGEPLLRQLRALEDRSVRYIRIYQQAEPTGWQTAGDAEHAAILDALTAEDEGAALSGLAHHLARTAIRVLSDCAPAYHPAAVQHAVAIAIGSVVVARPAQIASAI